MDNYFNGQLTIKLKLKIENCGRMLSNLIADARVNRFVNL